MDKALAEQKLHSIINVGRAEAEKGLARLAAEYQIRKDFIVKPAAVDIELKKVGDSEVWTPVIEDSNAHTRTVYEATPFARGQLLQHASIPQRFADTLSEYGLGDLLRENLRRLLPQTAPDGLLIREVGGTIKGALSTAYRRMDASPIFADYLETSLKLGYVPRTGRVTDTRALITFIRPQIIDVGDLVIFGHSLRTSDYGNGGLELDLYIERLICLNGMMGQDFLRKVHLGRRFEGGEGAVIELSQRTIDLDTKAVRSALKDVLGGVQKQLTASSEVLKDKIGADSKLNLVSVLDSLKKRGLKAATVEKVKQTYENTALPVEALPQQEGIWRLSNALSLLAKTAQDDESIELADAAYGVLGLKKVA